jgi:alanyl-tRNA synthetase
MKNMTSAEIRKSFLEFFEKKHHARVSSSALIPANDPSLLFTNAGMVQFKDVFLGLDKRNYSRATTSQKCLRVGGKHNDLDQVGFTKRHHTFFEMLGNFSFGDYFKEDAIKFAWEFLTEVICLPKDKLYVTVYKEDEESANIWADKINFPRDRIIYCGEKDNFWSMGDTGPCGPCTEIFYDHGPNIAGGPPGSPDEDGDRFVEIWNIVFMQYDRQVDQSLVPLPKPSVDTGMGLERISAVLQDTCDNFEIDIFKIIIGYIDTLSSDNIDDKAKRVMADHIRASAFLICDGIYPSNEGRGYVLRRVIRRAVRFGYKSGLEMPFFYKLLSPLIETMGDSYPELVDKKDIILDTIKREELQFKDTIKQGMKVLEKELEGGCKTLPGDVVFALYDTYGFPVDLTQDILTELGSSIDLAGYEECMAKQRLQSKQNQGFKDMKHGDFSVDGETKFLGYEQLESAASIKKIFINNIEVDNLSGDNEAVVVLDQTPCYAEGGGQVGDLGIISNANGKFEVFSTQKQGKVFLHYGKQISGEFVSGDQVNVKVDNTRQAIMLNHSATHLLHAALRNILGEHVVQKGSLVESDRLRFDFAHHSPITQKELREIEDMVNTQISRGIKSDVEVLDQDQAKASGAMALFEEKYDDKVRVIGFGDFSKELCGGTHVANTAEIGALKIVSESGIASGVRRIEAITGQAVLNMLRQKENTLANLAAALKVDSDNLEKKVKQLIVDYKEIELKLSKQQQGSLEDICKDIIAKAKKLSNGLIVAQYVFKGIDVKTMRIALDKIKSSFGNESMAVMLVSDQGQSKNPMIVYVSNGDKSQSAKEVLGNITSKLGGSGGGNAVMAQGVVADVSAVLLDDKFEFLSRCLS